jgi:hypothetical protein
MKLFHVIATVQGPSDWSVDSMRAHLRKSLTQSEAESAHIILLTETENPNVERSEVDPYTQTR